MENSNSREYLEKITAAVIDNLRHTGPAPSVQMQDVPRKPFGGMTDEEEAELDDLDEDENKDVRMSERRWEKRVEHEAEFEASDDEDMARTNGATRRNGNKRTFTDFRKSDKEDNSERASPATATNGGATEAPAAEDPHDINDDTIEDFSAAPEQEKMAVDKKAESAEPEKEKEAEPEKEVEKESEKEPEKVDDDGDVGMADSEPKEEMTIKKEDVEPEAAPERVPSKSPVAEEKPAEEAEPVAAAPATPAETPAPEEEPKPVEVEPEKAPEEEAPSEAKEKEDPSADAMEVDQEKEEPEPEPKKASTPPAA